MTVPIRPPFTLESAVAKVQAAEDAWNSRDPERVSLADHDGRAAAGRSPRDVNRCRELERLVVSRCAALAIQMSSTFTFRVARPTLDLERTCAMYAAGLGLTVLARFEDHDGFDGVVLGDAARCYQLEFTTQRREPVAPTPTPEDLLVFYLPDRVEWETASARMIAAGFRRVTSTNPYWDVVGQTFEDDERRRIVLQNGAWET